MLRLTKALVESGCADEATASVRNEAKRKADLAKTQQMFREGRVLEAAKLGLPGAQGEMTEHRTSRTLSVQKHLSSSLCALVLWALL